MIEPLEMMGWLTAEDQTPRPRAWAVNPEVHTKYADRAETETEARQTARELILNAVSDKSD